MDLVWGQKPLFSSIYTSSLNPLFSSIHLLLNHNAFPTHKTYLVSEFANLVHLDDRSRIALYSRQDTRKKLVHQHTPTVMNAIHWYVA